ncbi:hypothetical protein I7I50_08199 [Histoplasma capsulatum G186AR]|uniref:Uncharacterized protein n=1 Tax=Ajellomyces capsulatus TaxID=5037 RepID=A0A8H8CYR2_AJECA|nr:hypothetical protein I7I52_05716 [Histoplasma capsulatum]QSS73422.1 hypothetical protein I7I50_08199 [Histoplasma capsulatum G186AR]
MASRDNSPTSQPKSKPLNAEQLASQPLPPLSIDKNCCTTNFALHDIFFTWKLEPWETFQDEVASSIKAIEWSKKPLSQSLQHGDVHATEHFRCGDESSVSARFIQNALHMATAIGKEAGFTNVFGDWRATAGARKKNETDQKSGDHRETAKGKNAVRGEKLKKGEDSNCKHEKGGDANDGSPAKQNHLIPDYALLTENGCEVRLVGEAKTPWKHDIKGWCDDFSSDSTSLRHGLGTNLLF